MPLASQQDFEGPEPVGLVWTDLPVLVIEAKKQGDVPPFFLKYLPQ